MAFRQTLKVVFAVAILLLTALVSGAAGYTFGYLAGYDDGFDRRRDRQLREAAEQAPVDWTLPENQDALRRAFPPGR